MIHVKYRGDLAEKCGCTEEEIEARTVRAVLSHVKKAHGKAAYQECARLLITVDQRSITLLDNLRTRLSDGSTVEFLTISGGG